MTYLLDSSVLIALLSPEHADHAAAQSWAKGVRRLAVCPISEGALVRYLFRSQSRKAEACRQVLGKLEASPIVEFWPDGLSYRDVDLSALQGHKQATDAYLVALARSKGGRLATFDEALAAMYADVELIQT